MITPQMESITALSRNHKAVFTKLANGPVFLANRSKPVAAVLSMTDYEQMTEELKRLRRIIDGDKQLAEIRAGNYTELPKATPA